MLELTLVQGHGFLFRASDARVLREEHRIVGMLIGSLPAHPHQNIHLGLPLQLSKEEVTLLLELGLAEFKRKNNYPGNDLVITSECLILSEVKYFLFRKVPFSLDLKRF